MIQFAVSIAACAVALAGVPAHAAETAIPKAYVTGYSWQDNTPPGGAISNPVLHQAAGGVGTYADPITVAVGHSIINRRDILDYPQGTRFYISAFRRYFIVEDTCGDGGHPQNGPCHNLSEAPRGATTWLDVWVGGKGGTASAVDACMDKISDLHAVKRVPLSTYPVVPGPIFGTNGKCTAIYS